MYLEEKLQEVFSDIDQSNDHHISWQELQQCCAKIQIELDNEDREVFDSCKEQEKAGLSFQGFSTFVKLRLKKIFHEFDMDDSGTIEQKEISQALKKLNVHLASRQIDAILRTMDKNHDNKVDFDEFCTFFADIPSPNMQMISKRWGSACGLDYGSDIVPSTMPPVEVPLVQFIVAGGLAGVTSRTLTAPLEKIKIVAQTSTKRSTMSRMIADIWQAEGIRGMFSGNLTNCIRVFPTSAIVCMVYSRMIKYTPVDNVKNPRQPMWRFLSGGVAGIVATTMTHPLDVIRARFTVQNVPSRNTSHYAGIISAFRKIRLEEGTRGLYKGLVPSLVSIAPFLGVQQCAYDVMKQHPLDDAILANSATFSLGCGAAAGMLAQTVVHPLDVVRRQMQVEKAGSITRTLFAALNMLYKQGGVRRMYAGLTASYLKVIPAASTSLLVRDALLGRLEVK